jgi:hypothetical protein
MKNNIPNSSRLNIVGNQPRSDQEIFSSVLKHWQRKLGYCSIVAAVPAVLASNLPISQSAETKKPQARVMGREVRNSAKLNLNAGKRALLKRQSEFRLPHQSDDAGLTPLAGVDDCPGRAIPGGSYSATAPYLEVGDTTGANDTVTHLQSYSFYYGYYSYDTKGPDHVYTFTMTGRGPNPQIEVATTSGTYRPMVYVLQGGSAGACPTGTGNLAKNEMVSTDTRWNNGSTATLDHYQVESLPLNVPLYLFVDSTSNDANGSGPYTIRMQDVTIASSEPFSPLDSPEFFVRQQYVDFLNRQSDPDGLAFWMNEINSCKGDQACTEVKKINGSAAFFFSIEFQATGYLAYRGYKAAYGNLPNSPVPITLDEFQKESRLLGRNLIVKQDGWQQILENNTVAFVLLLVQSPRFIAAYPASMTPAEFVDRLFSNAGVTPTSGERNAAIDLFGGAALASDVSARARTIRLVAENPTLSQQEFNRAFVLMQYFGYLRRNPNAAPDGNFAGYNFWLDKLNQFKGDFNQAEMVKAFISSNEYRRRFGS